MGLYGAYFAVRGPILGDLKLGETTVVGKSFIYDIDEIGGVGTDPHSLNIPLFDTTGIINFEFASTLAK